MKRERRGLQGRTVADFVELTIPVEGDAPVRLTLHATKSWDYGVVQFAVNGKDVGHSVDLYSGENGKVVPSEPIDLGVQTAERGVVSRRATVVGDNAKAEGTRAFFGLDAVVLTREPVAQR